MVLSHNNHTHLQFACHTNQSGRCGGNSSTHATQVAAEQVASDQSWTLPTSVTVEQSPAEPVLYQERWTELSPSRPGLQRAYRASWVTGTKRSPLDSTSRQHCQNRADRNLPDSLHRAGLLLETQRTHRYWFYLFIILSLIYLYLCIYCFIPNRLHGSPAKQVFMHKWQVKILTLL